MVAGLFVLCSFLSELWFLHFTDPAALHELTFCCSGKQTFLSGLTHHFLIKNYQLGSQVSDPALQIRRLPGVYCDVFEQSGFVVACCMERVGTDASLLVEVLLREVRFHPQLRAHG